MSNKYKLNLGCGDDIKPAFLNVDFEPTDPRVQAVDLRGMWPWPDATFDHVEANQLVEHIDRGAALYHFVRELARVTRTGARVIIRVPHPKNSEVVWSHHEHHGPIYPNTITSLRGEHAGSGSETYFTLKHARTCRYEARQLGIRLRGLDVLTHAWERMPFVRWLIGRPYHIEYEFVRNSIHVARRPYRVPITTAESEGLVSRKF